MDFGAIYHFLFETFEGIGCLVIAGIILSIVACLIMERRTRKIFANHEAGEDEDDWSFFSDDSDDEEE